MIISQEPSIICPPPRTIEKRTVAVQQRKHIALYMPFGMTAGTLLKIARIRFVTSFPEGDTDPLTFFAGNKHFHLLSLASLKCCVSPFVNSVFTSRGISF